MVSSARRQDSATRLSRAQAVKNALLFHLHVSFAVSHVRLRGKSANKQQNAYNNNKIKNHSSRKKLGELATNLIQIPSTSSLWLRDAHTKFPTFQLHAYINVYPLSAPASVFSKAVTHQRQSSSIHVHVVIRNWCDRDPIAKVNCPPFFVLYKIKATNIRVQQTCFVSLSATTKRL